MPPMPTAWWFRPVSSAARVGEHIAVTWNPVVPQPLRGHPVVVRGADRTAEGAGIAEPGVIDQHEQDVRRAKGGLTWPINPQSGREPPSVWFATPRNGGRRMGSTVRSGWSVI